MALTKDQKKGLAVTVLFHLMIAALLILLGFSTPLPLPGEEGVEISLGTDISGSGAEEPSGRQMPPPAVTERETGTEQELVTQDTEPAVSLQEKQAKDEKPQEADSEKEQPVEQPVKEEPVVNPDALYKGKSQSTGIQANQGVDSGPGDQGDPSGSGNLNGPGGDGEGLSYSLKGRKPAYLPKPASNFTENGTVVVQITVDKYGKVVRAVAIDKGSNTTSTALRKLAVEAARKAIFNASSDAPEEQQGTITYHFIVRD
ncbi:MAG: TonB family protein [Bacteroidales bacterium]|nr:TonB family protein [Bacteroidales bacterium]